MIKKEMRAILASPGAEPEIIRLPIDGASHEEAIRDILEGNYGAIEFFPIEKGISLFLLVNDLGAVLGLTPNRRMPGKDSEQIIFGKAIFMAAYNGEVEDREGTLDLPDELCRLFIEQIKKSFLPCMGNEQPRPEDTVYYDEQDGQREPYRWQEIERPRSLGEPLQAGRVRFYQTEPEVMEVQERFFRKMPVYTEDSRLDF